MKNEIIKILENNCEIYGIGFSEDIEQVNAVEESSFEVVALEILQLVYKKKRQC